MTRARGNPRRSAGRTARAPRGALALAAAIVLLVLPGAAAACPKTSVADIEDEVMCPVCGTPLALATEAPQARRQREFILDLVERCRSKEQVKAALVAEFGENVLALPEDEGFDLAAYAVPALGFLLAGGALAAAAIRWRRRPAPDPAETDAPEPGEARRLEDDMRRYDL